MEMLQGAWKQHLRPHAVVGYGVKIFLPNLVPRAFLRRGEEGREKTLASADHVTNLNITFAPNLC